MAAVKYAPPAIPPKKKYRTISISQPGALGIGPSLAPAAIAKRQDRAHAHDQRRADREQRVDDDVALGQLWILGQIVRRRFGEQQEEGVEASQESLGVRAVELGLLEAHALQGLHALLGLGDQLVPEAELNRLGRAGLGARGAEAVVDPIVAEGALLGGPGLLVEAHDSKRARRDAVPAAVADVLVDVDGAVLGPVDRAVRARIEATRLGAVLADVGHEQPRHVSGLLGLLDEAHEPVRLVGEMGMVLVAAGPLRELGAQLVPRLARDLTGAAPDAQGGVGEHRQRAGHGYTTPFFTLQRNALVSWM